MIPTLKWELFQDFVRVARLLGKVPSWRDYLKHGKFHPTTIHRALPGGFRQMQELLLECHPEFRKEKEDRHERANPKVG